jgi:DNA-directed RNA polymerase specialized sigma24 family protein
VTDDDARQDAPPDSAPPEPAAGPPLSPDEARRRRTILSRPELLEALRETLNRCPEAHRDDILNQGVSDALAADGFPNDEGGLVFDFVANKVNNARGRFYYQRRRHADSAGPNETGDDVPAPADSAPGRLADAMNVAEKLAEGDPGAARALGILKARHIEGLSQEEAAKRANMSVAASYKATKRFTRALQIALAAVAVAVAWVFAPAFLRDLAHPNARDMTADHNPPAPPPSAEPTPEERAAPVVGAALAACDQKDWAGCLRKLDAASDIDPHIEADPRVVAARELATREFVKATSSKAPPSPPPPKAPPRKGTGK